MKNLFQPIGVLFPKKMGVSFFPEKRPYGGGGGGGLAKDYTFSRFFWNPSLFDKEVNNSLVFIDLLLIRVVNSGSFFNL